MKHKGFLFAAASAAAVLITAAALLTAGPFRGDSDEPVLLFRTEETQFLHQTDGRWEPFSMIGVNIGTGYPGRFPNDPGINERTYERWFNLMGDMNVNTVRVYQLQPPAFYAALLRYNETHDQPIYLLHSVYFPENLIYSEENLMDPGVYEGLFENTRDVVDALHGKLLSYDSGADRLNLYTDDVSEFVAGYILGVEWDPIYVEYICRLNEELTGYQGTYLTSAPEANSFEIFLSMWGDDVLRYETERYGTQPMISFANWPDTDPLKNELNTNLEGRWQQKTEITVDVEHILPTPLLQSGLFASYNVYPYFPAFLQYGDYTAIPDDTGSPNPYRAYLSDLTTYHSCPVLISEFGVPTSRNRAYADLWRGFSHGGLTEAQQGQACAAMLEDTRQAGCAGALVFSWQDEWYKTVWNERLISDPDRRAYWSNAQCAEQFFGLMAFEPGLEGATCYPDGDLSEWEGLKSVAESGSTSVYLQQDAKYLYFLVTGLDDREGMHTVNLALDIIPDAGQTKVGFVQMERGVDFVIRMDSGGGRLYVDQFSDLLPYSVLGRDRNLSIQSMKHAELTVEREQIPMPEDRGFRMVQRGENNVFANLSGEALVSPVGELICGNTNPASPDYAPNADCFFTEDAVELRIPWQLLNFSDPSQGRIVDVEKEIHLSDRRIGEIYAAVYFDDAEQPVPFGVYPLENWDEPVFHERLKESYYILKDVFGQVRSD